MHYKINIRHCSEFHYFGEESAVKIKQHTSVYILLSSVLVVIDSTMAQPFGAEFCLHQNISLRNCSCQSGMDLQMSCFLKVYLHMASICPTVLRVIGMHREIEDMQPFLESAHIWVLTQINGTIILHRNSISYSMNAEIP